jgi:phosphoribosylanthranilate isomerase
VFQVKICGVTNPEDGLCCSEAGADAIGLNFYPSSPRCVGLEMARQIARGLPPNISKVGVFVNAPLDEVLRTCEEVGLDAVQLHGDETPQMFARLAGRRAIKAFRCGGRDSSPVLEFLRQCDLLGCRPCAVLIDASTPGVYGGTGHTADWPLVRDLSGMLSGTPIILAGGLRPDNVTAAIEATRPAAVDTASGVELSPGRKDLGLVREFVCKARDALERLQRAEYRT